MLEIITVGDFDTVTDPVRTEETIFRQLSSNREQISCDYTYMALPLAHTINLRGLDFTQKLIDSICREFGRTKLFFVCQHILVKNLNFHDHLVFTPHATIMDPFVSIPHYACSYDLSMVKPWGEREYEFSFVGSFRTHPVRARLYELLKDRKDCYIEDTGNWHFEGTLENQEKNRKKYIEVLGNTKYSLCPRGTGPSSIRIWESMAMGACPIILSDFLQMPLERELNSTMWLKVSENIDNIENIESTDLQYNNKEYFDYFTNDKLYLTILKSFLSG